uniref:RNA-dependent RNA polymerase n=1 Tax=Plasmopara viticola lesion associated mitovirus 5 TaxID=2719478 RepID=A0A6G9RTA1_9VIRU|nr:RNA-dependent RNA polymerase [Plasmopara viticola lesion associated mitovirus 5]
MNKSNRSYLLLMLNNSYNIYYKILSLRFIKLKTVKYVPPFFKLFQHHLKHDGLKQTIKIFKQMRLHITRFLCNDPLFVNDLKIGVDKSGWPKRLDFLKELTDTTEGKRFLLTIVMLGRNFTLSKQEKLFNLIDISSISQPRKTYKEYIIPTGFISKFSKDYKLSGDYGSFNKSKDIYLSNKASINGPATLTAHNSILTLNYAQMQNIYDLTDEEGIKYFNEVYTQSFNNMSDIFVKDKLNKTKLSYSGKLSVIMDPELKVRVIAIFDYFSQVFLKPIHTMLLKNLKKFSCDRTFTQNPYKDWSNKGHYFWSMDLSSATDRFPISLQRRLMRELIGPKASSAWASLLTSREFKVPSGDDQTVKYAVGQPMGAYSSWAAFTLSHHLVVQWCAHLVNRYPTKDYIILGDDIVINDDAIAVQYKRVMRLLGVDLSEAKTHKSLDLYEFAKRWIVPSQKCEITGIPMIGIIKNINNPIIVFTILFDYIFVKGNYWSYSKTLVDFLVDLYHNLKLQKFQRAKKKPGSRKRSKLSYKFFSINVAKRFMSSLEIHSFSLLHTFGLSSDELKRKFIAENIPSELYVYHGERSLSEIFEHGMIKLVFDNYSKVQTLVNDLRSAKTFDKIEELKVTPLYNAIFNQLLRLKELLQDNLDKNLSPFEVSRDLTILDFKSIWDRERNKIATLISVGRSFRLGVKSVNSAYSSDEIYYGSTYQDHNFDLGSVKLNTLLINNIHFAMTYTLPALKEEEKIKEESVADAWANFFK